MKFSVDGERVFFSSNFQHNLLAWAYVCILLLLLLLPNELCVGLICFWFFEKFLFDKVTKFSRRRRERKKEHNNKNFKLYTAPKTRHTRSQRIWGRDEIKNTTTPIGYTHQVDCVYDCGINEWMNEWMNTFDSKCNAFKWANTNNSSNSSNNNSAAVTLDVYRNWHTTTFTPLDVCFDWVIRSFCALENPY